MTTPLLPSLWAATAGPSSALLGLIAAVLAFVVAMAVPHIERWLLIGLALAYLLG